MKTIDYLREVYGYGVPIFLKDVRIGRKSKTAIKQDIYRGIKSGQLNREGQGVYSLLDKENECDNLVLFEEIIENKFIKPDFKKNPFNDLFIYGYYSGLTFLNMMHLSQQVPAIREITTNRTSSKKRYYKIGNRVAIIRKGRTEITFQNWKILQFLDMFYWLTMDDIKENKELLMTYISNNFFKRDFLDYIKYYDTKIIKMITEGGLIYAFR